MMMSDSGSSLFQQNPIFQPHTLGPDTRALLSSMFSQQQHQQQDVAQQQQQQQQEQLLGNDQLQLMPLQNQPPPASFPFHTQLLQADNHNNIQQQQQQYLSRVPLGSAPSSASLNPQLFLNPYLSAGTGAGFEPNPILSAGGLASSLSAEQQQHYHQMMMSTLSTSASAAAVAASNPPSLYPVGNASALEMFNTTTSSSSGRGRGRGLGSRNTSTATSLSSTTNIDPAFIRHAANLDPVPVLSRKYGRTEPLADEGEDEAALSDFQVYARQQIEFFEAVESDVTMGARGRNNPISLGQGKMMIIDYC